jgi:protein-S-isoprenylcysteine O-methyltransferase Ste14
VIASYAGVLFFAAFIFLGAWTLAYPQGLVYVAVALVGVTLNHLLQPAGSDISVERARGVRAGEAWDKRILAASFAVTILMFLVAGLDSGHFGWSGKVPVAVNIAGVLLTLSGQVLFALAKRENEFFTSTARLQPERGQRVRDTGPYRTVRHPGYLGMLLTLIAFPLLMGSYWAFLPAAVAVVLLIARTVLEDRMLLQGLDGYADYAGKTKWRLVPGVF